MNDRTPCVDHESLVTYLYDECEPADRQSIAAHVAICTSCAEEVRALSDTRAHLASWSPPALPLGFQLTRTESDPPAQVLDFAAAVAPKPRSGEGGWWRKPLPAWAQAAAAVVIFAAGMSVNAGRSSAQESTRVAQAPAPQQRATVTAPAPVSEFAVTRAEFARLEARLRAMERADVSRASYEPDASAAPDASASDDLRAQVNALTSRLAAYQEQNLNSFREVAVALNAQRRDIDANRETAQNVTVLREEVEGHRKVLLNPMLMRTALTSTGR